MYVCICVLLCRGVPNRRPSLTSLGIESVDTSIHAGGGGDVDRGDIDTASAAAAAEVVTESNTTSNSKQTSFEGGPGSGPESIEKSESADERSGSPGEHAAAADSNGYDSEHNNTETSASAAGASASGLAGADAGGSHEEAIDRMLEDFKGEIGDELDTSI
jgi:hypothetical protein